MNKKPLSSKISLDIAEYLHKTIDTDYNFIKTDEADNLVPPCYYEVFDYFFEKGYVIKSPKNKKEFDVAFKIVYDLLIDLYKDFPIFKNISAKDYKKYYSFQ